MIFLLPSILLGSSIDMVSLKERALAGDADAQFKYGTTLIENGSKNTDEIIHWLTQAADQNNFRAQTNLGIIYYFGDLGEQSYEKSYKFFKEASDNGDPSAKYYLGISLQRGQGAKTDPEKGLEYLLTAAEEGMPYAQLSAAQSYENAIGVEKDLFQAVSWYAYAAQAGLEEAKESFKRLYYSNHFVDDDGNQRLFWFETENLSNRKKSEAMSKDPFYFVKNNIPVQVTNGKFLSAETGYGFNFGFIEGEMFDVTQIDMLPLVSEPIFSNLALQNLMNGSTKLGFTELDFVSNITRYGAVFLSDKSSNKVISIPGSPETHFLTEKAMAENFSNDINEDFQERIAQAYFNVGQMLFDGHGTEQDQDEAMQYYYKSAELLNPDANYVMGALIRRSGNQETSHQFFMRGAKLGNLNSQYNVATDFFNGDPVPKDLEQAFYWALIVEKRGDAEILPLIEKIKEELDQNSQSQISAQVDELFSN